MEDAGQSLNNLPEQASEEALGRVELLLGLGHQGQGLLLVLTHDVTSSRMATKGV